MYSHTLAVDAVPESLMPRFLQKAKEIHDLWHDMFLLCATFGLRNIECRELKVSQIDLKRKVLTLYQTKSEKANVTKNVNKQLDKQWIAQGRHWLRKNIYDNNAALIVRLANSTEELAMLAQEYQLGSRYQKAKDAYYRRETPLLIARYQTQQSPSRRIDFSAFSDIEAMLHRRVCRHKKGGFLFPREELKKKQRDNQETHPLSRQSVYNVLQKIRTQLGAQLKGIRIGLHSCRKFAVQKVASLMKDTFAASVWIGHGKGRGNLSMTERYLNRSAHRYNEINLKLSKACRFGLNDKPYPSLRC